MVAVIIRTDPHLTNRHDTEQTLLVRKRGKEWAVSHELVTLIAAAVATTDEWPATAGHVCVCGRARLSEQELWMVCSTLAAPLACASCFLRRLCFS